MGSCRGWWVRAELFKSDTSVFEELPALLQVASYFPSLNPSLPPLYSGDKVDTSDDYHERDAMQNRVKWSYPVSEQHILIFLKATLQVVINYVGRWKHSYPKQIIIYLHTCERMITPVGLMITALLLTVSEMESGTQLKRVDN